MGAACTWNVSVITSRLFLDSHGDIAMEGYVETLSLWLEVIEAAVTRRSEALDPASYLS